MLPAGHFVDIEGQDGPPKGVIKGQPPSKVMFSIQIEGHYENNIDEPSSFPIPASYIHSITFTLI